ncbi:unnamed protein product [Caenorhabditis brenneri]
MTDNVENLITKTANLGTDPKFEKWNNLPPGVQAEYAEAMRANNSSSTDNIVKLDIGGTVFKTSKSTLTKFDGFIKTMLETDVPITKDKSDCIFIDRSAKHFDKILNFMRDGNVDLPDSIESLKEIQKEAQYYLLDGLVELCSEEVVKKNGENNTIRQNTEDEIRVIETDTEFARIMNRASGKPALIIYFLIDSNGRSIPPRGFYLLTFLNEYKHKLDIYLKGYRFPHSNAGADQPGWHCSLHYRCGYSYLSPKQKHDYNLNEVPETFEVQLVKAIDKFFDDNKIVI